MVSRAERLPEGEGDCVEKGYLLLPVGYQGVYSGNAGQAHKTFVEAACMESVSAKPIW